MLSRINKETIIKWISMILISLSFSLFSFYQMVKYENLYIVFTILISFVSAIIFTKKTINNVCNYVKKNPKKCILFFLICIIIVLAMHESKGVLYKDYIIWKIRIFRLRYWLFVIPSIFYLLVWVYEKINKFVTEFKKSLTKKDKKLYFYITIISSVLVFVSYLLCDQWYQQYDIVYSLDSGYIYENMIPKLGYYDIRHPFLTIFIFPVWAICEFISKLLIPSQIASCVSISMIQIINIQLLLMIAFMLKKITKNKWILYLYLFSSPVLLFTMFLEKYQLCTFLLVLYVYLYLKNNKDREDNLILATSIMPTSAFIYIHEFLHKDKLINKFKNLFKTIIHGFLILICFGKIHLMNPTELINELTKMTQTFSSSELSLDKCLISFFNMIHSSLFGLSSIKDETYLWSNVIDKISILGVIIFIIVIIGFIFNRKDKFVKICIVWITVSLALFTVFKWSIHESPLFGIYFSWAIIPLFQKGLDVIIKKMKWNDNTVYSIIISIMAIINILNIVDIALFFR